MYRYLQKCLYRGLCPKLSTNSLHLVFTVSLLSSSEGFDVQCVMVKEHEKAVSARVFYGLFLFYSMICTTFAHCMLWYA